MAEQEHNWIGWAIDVLRLWSAKGGGLAIGGLMFGLLMSFGEGMPPYLSPLLILAGCVVAGYAFWVTYRVLKLGGSGVRLEGTVGGVDQRRRSRNSRTFTELRAVFSYDHAGNTYQGQSAWASKKVHQRRYGDIEPGNRIALVVDPTDPNRVMPLAEIPNLGWHVR